MGKKGDMWLLEFQGTVLTLIRELWKRQNHNVRPVLFLKQPQGVVWCYICCLSFHTPLHWLMSLPQLMINPVAFLLINVWWRAACLAPRSSVFFFFLWFLCFEWWVVDDLNKTLWHNLQTLNETIHQCQQTSQHIRYVVILVGRKTRAVADAFRRHCCTWNIVPWIISSTWLTDSTNMYES